MLPPSPDPPTAPAAVTATDAAWMRAAIMLAERGLGTTAPNPAVGAVLVQPGSQTVVGRGWTQAGGRPHAEPEAIGRAGEAARGSTLYVTLEPCSHHGKTPPCADAVLAAGVSRVVAGGLDPDPRVAGRGLDRLRAAGVTVAVCDGPLAEACRWLTLGHIHRVTMGRPFIKLKVAVGPDGRMPLGNVRVTGPEAARYTHLLRARADAILTGIGTVLADDPELTCRLPGMAHRSPRRVVLDSRGRLPATARVLQPGAGAAALPTLAVTGPGQAVPPGCERMEVPVTAAGGLDVMGCVQQLAAHGITRLMVEAGPKVAQSFLDGGLVDEVVVLTGHRRLPADARTALPFAGGVDGLIRRFGLAAWQGLGTDSATVYRSRISTAPADTPLSSER